MNGVSFEQVLAQARQLRRTGELRRAEALCGAALERSPGNPQALLLLGEIVYLEGRPAAAVPLLRKGIAGAPDRPELRNLLGVALFALGQNAEAIAAFQTALRLAPRYVEAMSNLAEALRCAGRAGEAAAACRAALAIQPDQPGALVNLGSALRQEGKLAEAAEAFEAALRVNPNWTIALRNLGIVLLEMGRLIEAARALEKAIKLDPKDAEAHNALGNALRLLGRPDEALVHLRRAVELRPESAVFQSNLLFALNYCPSLDAKGIAAEHFAWGRRCDCDLKPSPGTPEEGWVRASHDTRKRPHPCPLPEYREREKEPPIRSRTEHQWPSDRDPDRPLRVGYVSPDFRAHSIAFFIEPILEHHDRKRFEVFCYACWPGADNVTERLRHHAHQWREIHNLSDEQAANLIRSDRIDILLDLAVHSPHNRLGLFARKPAPVQGSYLGYAGTTGLPAMDYRLTDALIDPPGLTESHHSERLLRLPRTLWCFRPPLDSPAVAPTPCRAGGAITFGSANMPSKITPGVIALWAKVLEAVPGSRLLAKGRSLDDPAVQRHFAEAFGARGIGRERLAFEGHSNLGDFLNFFSQVDLVLDTFPFNGGTITCLALWMGVPVITLARDRSVSRVGVSILTNLGLPELIAHTDEEYVRIASAMPRDPQKLTELRAGMRQRMHSSPLMDEQGFVRELEQAYRGIWRQWRDSAVG